MGLARSVTALVVAAALVVTPAGPAGPVRGEPALPDGPVAGSVADSASAADAVSAAEIARLYDHAVVVESETTQTSQVQALADGTMQLTQNALPVRVLGDSGWEPVDLTLMADGGVVRPRVSPVGVAFSGGGSGPLATVSVDAERSVSVSWPVGDLPAPTLSGPTATYPEVLPGVDLMVTATVVGMSQVLVVKSAQALANPALGALRFGLGSSGLHLRQGAAGVAAVDGSGEVVLASGVPMWWDSRHVDAGVSGPGLEGQARPLQAGFAASSLSVDVAAGVDAPGVTFPVFIDPDWTGTKTGYIFVDSAYSTMSYWNGAGASDLYAHVGFIAAQYADDVKNHTTRAFWNMSVTGVKNKRILDATFTAKEVHSSSCTATAVELWKTGAASSSTSWNSQPAWSTKLDTKTVAYGHAGCGGNSDPHDVVFDATAGVVTAAAAGASSLSLGLRAGDESDTLSWKKFDAGAKLKITYNTKPGTPSSLSVTPCAFQCAEPTITRDATPVLQGKATDADGDLLDYRFEVWKGHAASPTSMATSGSTSNIASDTVASWTVGSALADGDYEYRVRVDDDIDTGGWSVWRKFVVDTTAPAAPTLTASGPVSTDPDGFAGTIGESVESVTISSKASDHAWGYVYTIVPRGVAVTYPVNVSCGSTAAGLIVVCPGTVGVSKKVSFSVPSAASRFTAWTFDAAGNAHSAGSYVDFFAKDSDLIEKGHLWSTDDGPRTSTGALDTASCPTGDVPDVASQAVDLQVSGSGVCWSQVTGPVASGSLWALSFGSGSGYAATPSGVVDPTGAFTVSAWLRPTATGAKATAISQNGPVNSAFELGLSASGTWQFCVREHQTSSPVCATSMQAPVSEWAFVAGTYNRAQHELLLYVTYSGYIASSTTAHTTGVQVDWTSFKTVVGRGQQDAVGASRWAGQILHPAVMPGVASVRQLNALGANFKAPKNTAEHDPAAGTDPYQHTDPQSYDPVPYDQAQPQNLTATQPMTDAPLRGSRPAATTASVSLGPVHATAKTADGVAAGTPISAWHEVGESGLSLAGVAASGAVLSKSVASGSVQAAVLSREQSAQLGTAGLVVSLDAPAGWQQMAVRIPDTAVLDTFGGDYAQRIKWVTFPASGSITDARDAETTRVEDGVVVTVPAGGGTMRLAAVSLPKTNNGVGDFTATPLHPSASWQVGLQSGSFTYTYPMAGPPVPAGPTPAVALNYDSGSVDGMTASTNNQAGPIGSGWSLSGGGSITRQYTPCARDGEDSSPDLCWGSDNAMISFGGHSGLLIHDTATDTWKLQNDDDTEVAHLTGTTNRDGNGEYWRLTTTDGTRYYFGLNRLPGWTSGDDITRSAWSVPVYGNDPGEPCHAATFAASVCNQAWQWNLDWVVDPHGNAEALYYTFETGRYMRGTTEVAYQRGGQLDRIEYGMRSGTQYDGTAPARIVFDAAYRCVQGWTCDTAHPESWPDVPWDLYCEAGQCGSLHSPSFFVTRLIDAVHAQARIGGAYVTVDDWTFNRKFPGTGDETSASLWLYDITHKAYPTGHAIGAAVTLPPVTFHAVSLPNRVVAHDDPNRYDRYRISWFVLETGGQITVSYTAPQCTSTSKPASAATNTMRCFPAPWLPPGSSTWQDDDYFHKYLVTSVVADPAIDDGEVDSTFYSYLGSPAWRYNDTTPLLTPDQRTWSQFAGYAKVKVSHGDENKPAERETTITTFMRGLNGTASDKAGGTKTVTVSASDGSTVPDWPAFAGQIREQQTYLGDSGTAGGATVPAASKQLTTTINTQWRSTATATDGEHSAYLTGISRTDTHTKVSGDGIRDTAATTGFDVYGRPIEVNDLGDTADAGDNTCTRTSYVNNPSGNMLSYPAETTVVAAACTATPSMPDDAISGARYLYDGATTVGAAPTKGDVTETWIIDHYTTGATPAPVWVKTAEAVYDSLGRVTTVTDPRGATPRTTATAYTPAGFGLTTQVTTTNTLGWSATTSIDAARGLSWKVTDVNGNVTRQDYDALGRLVKVWTPELTYGDPNGANVTYGYHVSATGPSWISTRTRTAGTWYMSYQIFDGLGRGRQTQQQAPNNSGAARVLTDTFYDRAGRAAKTNDTYFATGAPGGTLLNPKITVPTWTTTTYDGYGRPTVSILHGDNTELYRTSNTYDGMDTVRTTPPAGGTQTLTVTDAHGRTTRTALLHNTTDTVGDATTYTYDARGNMSAMVDAIGATWTWAYDSQGRVVTEHDPDAGTTTTSYDQTGRVSTVTDARGKTVRYGYDPLGRPVTLVDDATGANISRWVYDTAGKGLLYRQVSYDGTDQYLLTTNSYDSSGRPTRQSVTIPASAGPLASTYSTNKTYWVGGLLQYQTVPTVAGISGEYLTYGYNQLGLPVGVGNRANSYLDGAEYTQYSQLAQTVKSPNHAYVIESFTRDQHTGRLTGDLVQRVTSSYAIVARHFLSWQDSGLLTGDVNNVPAVGVDKQCYRYDYAGRLTQAFTPPGSAQCTQGPAAGLTGPAPYWTDWTYDTAGSRTAQIDHPTTTTGGATQTSTYTYTYPAPSAARPHAVSQVTRTSSAGGTPTTTGFAYNAAGSATTRGTLTIGYDTAGRATDLHTPAGDTHRVFTPDGQLLYQKGPDGATLILAALSDTILHATPTGQLSGQRTYTVGGITVAQRTGNGTSDTTHVAVTDPINGTITATIDTTTTMTVNRRYTDPYGNLRGTTTTWPGNTGYLNAPIDTNTALTRLGVRDYDPTLGRFLTVDPILAPYNPPQNNGYTYAAGNPITNSDPTGRSIDDAYASKTALCAHYGGCGGPTGHDCVGKACVVSASGALVESGEIDLVDFAVQSTTDNLGHGVLKSDGSPEWKALMGKYNRPGDVPAEFAAEMLYQGYPLWVVDQYYSSPCTYQLCHFGDPLGALLCDCLIETPIDPQGVRLGRELSDSLLVSTARAALTEGKGGPRAGVATSAVADTALVQFRADTSHIFRSARGHLAADTPANRQIIRGAVMPEYLASTRTLGGGSILSRYYRNWPDGTQAWADVRDGIIVNGGLNVTPR